MELRLSVFRLNIKLDGGQLKICMFAKMTFLVMTKIIFFIELVWPIDRF